MFALVISILIAALQGAAVCSWGVPVEVGTLTRAVSESSGMAISRRFRARAYRINDSGDRGRFFAMNIAGGDTQSINIEGFMPTDTEDMAIGPCGGGTEDCLFFGDIGDNNARRSNIEIVVVRERSEFPATVRPDSRVRVRYPDGPHDAESLGVHPNGNIYILTKDSAQSQLFRLNAGQWRDSKGDIETLALVANIDWSTILPDISRLGRLATAMDIAPDGKRFLVLTYTEAVEFFFDLSTKLPPQNMWRESRDFRRVALTTLEQQEAIAYFPDSRGFLYDTERAIESRPARVFRTACRN
jgi:hypothetical protein